MTYPVRCIDGCGTVVKDMSEAQAKAWTYLEITKRYRCPACTKALEAVNNSQPRKEDSK